MSKHGDYSNLDDSVFTVSYGHGNVDTTIVLTFDLEAYVSAEKAREQALYQTWLNAWNAMGEWMSKAEIQ